VDDAVHDGKIIWVNKYKKERKKKRKTNKVRGTTAANKQKYIERIIQRARLLKLHF
jgi:hypothetical protein